MLVGGGGMDVAAQKRELRHVMRGRLSGQGANERQAASLRLCDAVCALDEWHCCDAVLSYMPLAAEADVTPVNMRALSLDKTLSLPRCYEQCHAPYGRMWFHVVDAAVPLDRQLEQTRWHLREPPVTAPLFVPQKGQRVLVLVPGLAFAADGSRLGRGKGFYDECILCLRAALGGAVTFVGVGFGVQLLDAVPCDTGDQKVDRVLCP